MLATYTTAYAQQGVKREAERATALSVRMQDSLRVINLEEVQVVSTRAHARTPIAFSNLSKEAIGKQNFGQDIPFLLSSTPSVLTTSDAGTGIGYTGIRVRGTDATRINITANGIPMNDAESHSIFWVNTPDFASSLEDMQIQRGAGSSTNGSGAFGASINMRTQATPTTPYAEISGSYGSFNTHKETVKVGSGLLGGRWVFDARVSNIQSNGYRDRAWADMKSYFVQGGYFGERTTVKFITFGGNEKTYHAWDGISRQQLKENRTYNPNGAITEPYTDVDGEKKTREIGFYDDQTDNYRQTHYQLHLAHVFSPLWSMNAALHYTDGFGYYQEYKNLRTLKEYGLKPFYQTSDADGDGTPDGEILIKKSDLVRKKLLDNGFGGGVFSVNYSSNRLTASLGGGANYYSNDHFGEVIWVKGYIGDLAPNHEYYRNTGNKFDANLYAKANYQLTNALSAYADLQYRHIDYRIKGANDKWDWTAQPEQMQQLDIDQPFGFFNPKAGLFWQIAPAHATYASFAVAQKEPTRNNYTDRHFNEPPRPEKMFDYEVGYSFRTSRFSAGLNLYYMDYKDQLVLNGRLNEIGEPMAENVKESYRMGVEASLGARLTDWLRWDVNATWSKNRIKDYVGYVPDANWESLPFELGNTPIALSPSLIANSNIGISHKGWNASLQTQYASRQYLDNFGVKENSLDAYAVSHLHGSYTFALRSVKKITLGASIYNIFNTRYETNGYSQTTVAVEEGGKTTFTHDPRFYPMAGTNALVHLTLRF